MPTVYKISVNREALQKSNHGVIMWGCVATQPP